MRRRDVLKGAAVVAGVAVVGLPVVAEGKVTHLMSETYNDKDRRMRVELYVYPDADGKFKGRFQERVEDWERQRRAWRPVEAVTFEPQMEDGSPWLVHEAWKPVAKDNLGQLHTLARNIFRERRWDIIERAINLREMGYWRQEYLPQMPTGPRSLDGGGMSPAMSHLLMFRRGVRARLYRVAVRFEAIPLSELRRHLGATDPEYARLEDELEALKNLNKKGKLIPRAYYKGRVKRWDRLAELEEVALDGRC